MHGLVPRPRQRTCWLSAILLTASCAAGCVPDDHGPPEAAALSDAIARHQPPEAAPGPLVIVGVAPSRPAFTTDDRRHLLFELVLQNTSDASVELAQVDVLDPDRRAPLASYRDAALAGVLTIAAGAGATPNSLAPGGVAVAFFDLPLALHGAVPDRLVTRFALRQGDATTTMAGPSVAVIDDRARPIGPPLHGGRLLDVNGCCDGAHRRALFALDGGLFLAQRFAIDFVRIDDQSTFAGDPTKNESYFLFGAEVVSVARGRVVEATDGMAENVPTQPLPPFDIQTAAGNHVVVALDDGRFALYAHLQTGSVRVHPGDRVERGHVLGLVGNTGNSTEPHLHFHVMDGPAPLESDGLPYTFDRFELQATVDIATGVPVVVPVPPPQQRRDRLPLGLDLLEFR
jgi:hypothetical protein